MENWLALFGICGSFCFHMLSVACSGRTFRPVREELSPSCKFSNRSRLIRRRSEILCDPEILCGRICEKLLTQIHRKNRLKCVCRMRRPRDIRF